VYAKAVAHQSGVREYREVTVIFLKNDVVVLLDIALNLLYHE